MKDSWKRPIKTQKQIDYPTQTQFVFKPRDATPEEAKEWQEKYSNIKRLDIIKGAGHCPHDEKPEETNRLIYEFVQETK